MTRKRGLIAALLGLALLIAGGYASRQLSNLTPAPTNSSGILPSPVPAPDQGGTSAARTTQARLPPLPPPGMPIGDIVGPLQARADAGDSRAACRLAMELLRCTHLDQTRHFQTLNGKPLDVLMAEQGNHEAADRLAEMQIRQIELRQRCEAVDASVLAQAPRYLRAAARAGEPEAMLRYAIGAQHGPAGVDGFVRDPDLDTWRRESPAMLMNAMRNGRPEAVDLLLSAYQGDGTPFAGLVANDPVMAHAYRLLRQKMWAIVNDTPEDLDAAALVRAERLASEWHRLHFQNRVFAPKITGLQLPPLDGAIKPLDQDRFCEPPGGL